MQDPTRRWTRRPRYTLSDAAVWVTFTLLTAASLLAMCLLLTLIWPATP
jgi:steroid 5-alpha reductase family enzyme